MKKSNSNEKATRSAIAPRVVVFSGSRRLSPIYRPLVQRVVESVAADGRIILVGCANGADAFVREAAPAAKVFKASNYGEGPGSFARRSIAMVERAATRPGSGLIVFPGLPCPEGLLPSPRSAACFCGLGSGSWASAALATGLGLSVIVFPCGFSELPAWGEWQPAGSGVWTGGFLLRLC